MMSNRTPDTIENGAKRQDSVRNIWKKQIECEERVKFWRSMINCGAGVRELESIGENIKEKFRSVEMKNGGRERDVVMLVMSLRLKDEKKHQIELKKKRNTEKEKMKEELGSIRQYKLIMTKLNKDSKFKQIITLIENIIELIM